MHELTEIFPWNDNFATGNVEIDNQHRQLISLINKLALHLTHRADDLTLECVFNELADYAAYHFRYEEDVWSEHFGNDKWRNEHQHGHSDFITKLLALRATQNDKSFEAMVEEILTFLTHWLAYHILDSDKRMAMTVTLIQGGMNIEQAKQQTDRAMSGSVKILLETILSMYDRLSSRTLQLMREINDRQKAEARLRLINNVFQNTLDAICITDQHKTIIDANPAFCHSSQLSRSEIIGRTLSTLKSGFSDSALSDTIWHGVNNDGHWSGTINNRSHSGTPEAEWLILSAIADEHGNIANYVCVFSNISQLIQQQKSLEQIASHDALTGLPNRLLLDDRLLLAVAHAERTGKHIAVCFIDLDGFKAVNDQFGHAAGDELLQEIARRIKSAIRSEDCIARLGGDEFVLLFNDLEDAKDCDLIIRRILGDISRPVIASGHPCKVTASIGIACYPQNSSNAEQLIHLADQAMYQAKKAGKSRHCFYENKT